MKLTTATMFTLLLGLLATTTTATPLNLSRRAPITMTTVSKELIQGGVFGLTAVIAGVTLNSALNKGKNHIERKNAEKELTESGRALKKAQARHEARLQREKAAAETTASNSDATSVDVSEDVVVAS